MCMYIYIYIHTHTYTHKLEKHLKIGKSLLKAER